MKFKLLFLVLFVISSTSLRAQQDLGSFVDESNLWYNYGGSFSFYGPIQRFHVYYFFQGDTIIGSYSYKKMYYKVIDSSFNNNNGTLHHVTNYPVRYEASFRQEGKKVYSVQNYYNNNNEFLYIDFNMQVGDTINYKPFGTIIHTVTAIDSIPFGNQYRKRFTTTGGTIYEGIGHQFGIFRNNSVAYHGTHYLSCFHQYGETQDVYYFNDNAPCYNYNSPTYNSQGATFTCSTPTQCGGSSFSIHSSTAGFESYLWNITGPGGYVSNHSGQNINITLSQPGYYNVSLSATFNGVTETHTETSYLNVIPQPTVSAPSSICLGSNGQLSPISGGTWSSSNNSIASVTNQGYVYSNNQGYVIFTFTDAQTGCSRPTTVEIVNQYVSIPSTTMCVDGTIQLTPNSGGIWMSNNPSVASITNTGLVTALSQGSTNFTFTNSTNGCSRTTQNLNVNLGTNPIISVPSAFCENTVIQLLPSTGGNWTSNGAVWVSNNGLVSAYGPGNATFTFINLLNGCSISSSPVEILSLPSVSSPTSFVCVNSTIQLSPNTGGTWVSNNPSIASVTNDGLVTGLTSGNVFFTFTNSSTGCSRNTNSINVRTVLYVNPIPDKLICSGDIVNATFFTGNAQQYVWTNNNINIGLGASGYGSISNFTASNNTTYNQVATITVNTNNNSCGSIPTTFTITVKPKPNVNAGNDTTICLGQSYILNAITNADSISWNNNLVNGTVVSPNVSSFNTVIVIQDGCFNSDSVLVSVIPSTSIVYAGNDTTICYGQTYTLNATSNTNIITWNNNLSNGSIITPTLNTQFVVTSGTNGCEVTDTVIVIVNPLPILNTGNDTTICAGEVYILNTTSNTNDITWNNNLPNGSIVSPTLTEQFIVTANQSGCQNSDTLIVTVNQLPIVNAGNDTTICAGEVYILNATSNTNDINWNNNLPNGSIVSPTLTEQFIVTANQSGCQNSDTLIVTVNPLPIVNAGNDTTICIGESFTPNSFGNATTSQWSTGLTNGIAFIPSLTSTLILSGELNGCLSYDSVLITVSNPNLSITSFDGEDSLACDGTASVLIVNGIAPYSYIWTNNSINYTTPSIQNLCSGIYSLSIVDAIGCQGSSNATINDTLILIQTIDTLYFTDIIYQDSTVIGGDTSDWIENCTFDYNLVIGANIASYNNNGITTTVNWFINLSNGTSIPIDVIYPLNIDTIGIYEFTLQLFCSAKTDPRFIEATSRIYVDNSTISVQSLSLNSVLLFPNPATSTISIVGATETFRYEIRDIQGKLVKQGATEKEIDIASLTTGTYLISFSSDKEMKQLRFVKL
ncbi:MAG: T9SS type A sorting domain-containing protein [Flavobacteriales bacterium]|nr:T9SS type A sorting domain-containing protein [Flavobacteriales bacterium]